MAVPVGHVIAVEKRLHINLSMLPTPLLVFFSTLTILGTRESGIGKIHIQYCFALRDDELIRQYLIALYLIYP